MVVRRDGQVAAIPRRTPWIRRRHVHNLRTNACGPCRIIHIAYGDGIRECHIPAVAASSSASTRWHNASSVTARRVPAACTGMRGVTAADSADRPLTVHHRRVHAVEAALQQEAMRWTWMPDQVHRSPRGPADHAEPRPAMRGTARRLAASPPRPAAPDARSGTRRLAGHSRSTGGLIAFSTAVEKASSSARGSGGVRRSAAGDPRPDSNGQMNAGSQKSRRMTSTARTRWGSWRSARWATASSTAAAGRTRGR